MAEKFFNDTNLWSDALDELLRKEAPRTIPWSSIQSYTSLEPEIKDTLLSPSDLDLAIQRTVKEFSLKQQIEMQRMSVYGMTPVMIMEPQPEPQPEQPPRPWYYREIDLE
jgi:hypothetical protein